ncbi:putative sulfate exporter family transporter, partial [Paratractidigestivibacter sp.]
MAESLDLAKKGKGILLCLAIAVVAWICGQHAEVVGGPVFGILFGMLLAQVLRGRDASSLQPGIKFTSKYILQAAVVFLGFGLNLA